MYRLVFRRSAFSRVALVSLTLFLVAAGCQQGPTRAAFVGDSLTLGVGSSDHFGYVGYLSAELEWQSTRYVWYHLADSILLLDDVDHFDVLILELGAHTLTGSERLASRDETLFRRYYALLLDKAGRHAGTVIALTLPWLNWGPEKEERAAQYNAIIREEAARRGALVVDIWGPMKACGQDCVSEDDAHPNDKGHQVIADQLVQHAASIR